MGMAVAGGLGIISKVMDYNSQMDAANSKAKAATQAQDMKFQDYEIERQDAFDSTVNQLTNVAIKQNQQVGAVKTALGETMKGNTARLLERNTQGDSERSASQIKNNYQQKSGEIDLNKESTALSTTSYLSSIKKPSTTALVLGATTTAYNVYQSGQTAQADATTKGVGFSWDNYLWKGSGATITPK